jgi:hypothetical protein
MLSMSPLRPDDYNRYRTRLLALYTTAALGIARRFLCPDQSHPLSDLFLE